MFEFAEVHVYTLGWLGVNVLPENNADKQQALALCAYSRLPY